MGLSVRSGRPVRKPGVWLRQAGDENAVYDPSTGAVHLLNASALAIWDLCDGETQPEEMIAAICTISGLPPDVVAEDVERVLTQFEDVGIIVWGE
jgi:PqqD family protein of HPr-rel-A system